MLKEHALQVKFRESHGRQFPSSKEQPSRAVQLCSVLYPASSIPQLEISHAVTLQPGSAFDAAHTRMVCALPGLQPVTEEL